MHKVILTGYIIVPEHELEMIKQALAEHIKLTRNEAGCEQFNVTQNSQQSQRFEVHEIFSSQAAFDAHQLRVKNSDWGRASVNVERHYHIEKVEVN
ncbi:antibiotic biosynthesis monooxygenase [Catenovulum sp. 2E275]|uniref:putative quinol monooxygenase n=1 Tax=Catenovulum sp. 2E275 TaxID=2980497 RepID=UPI0021D1848F|nr:antibiotic biosynthesis monooxygenase [Catenovulum sp. 2E275]MCU4675903.1 antibiotic biosynthesis monooxygenase [Catenovulum sp. 2E275]